MRKQFAESVPLSWKLGGIQNETDGSCRLESVNWIYFLESNDVQVYKIVVLYHTFFSSHPMRC